MEQLDLSTSDKTKRSFLIGVLRFLQEECKSSNPDKKESLEVAIQCIESVYDIDYYRDNKELPENVDLLNIFNRSVSAKKDKPSPGSIAEAEICKNKGNDLMRNGMFKDAIEQYTKAIYANPENAIYYCNRAAAYSRLDLHVNVIEDCECAVKIDPSYGKAFGRLGIAYSNLNMFKKARDAYIKALQLDPGNIMYQENLKLTEEQILATPAEDAASADPNVDLNQFMTNPNLLNMASQMLNDPGVRDVMSGILQIGTDGGNPNIDALLTMGQQLAEQMQLNNPTFVDNLRRQFSGDAAANEADSTGSLSSNGDSKGNPPSSKDDNASS